MGNIWLYIHLSFLAVALVGIVMADHSALLWLHGKRETLDEKHLYRNHWIVSVALTGLVLTGLYQFWPLRDYLLNQPQFWVKMIFVLVLLINSFFVEALLPLAVTYRYAELSGRQKVYLALSGVTSSVSWLMVILAAWYLFGWPF